MRGMHGLVLMTLLACCRSLIAEPATAAPGDGRVIPAGPVRAVAFSPEGRSLATVADDGVVRVWDTATARELKRNRIELARGEGLVIVEEPPPVRVLADGEVVVLVHKCEKTGPNRQGVVSSCLWKLSTGQRSPWIETGYGGRAVCPQGRRLAYGGNLWDIASGRRIRQFNLPEGLIFDIGFSPDGKIVAYQICESLAQNSSVIHLVDTATGRQVLQTGNLASFVLLSPPVFSPDSRTIAYQGAGTLYWADLAGGRKGHTEAPIHEKVLGFSSGKRTILGVDVIGGALHRRSSDSGKLLGMLEIAKKARSVVLSPDGRLVAIAAGEVVELRKIAD